MKLVAKKDISIGSGLVGSFQNGYKTQLSLIKDKEYILIENSKRGMTNSCLTMLDDSGKENSYYVSHDSDFSLNDLFYTVNELREIKLDKILE